VPELEYGTTAGIASPTEVSEDLTGPEAHREVRTLGIARRRSVRVTVLAVALLGMSATFAAVRSGSPAALMSSATKVASGTVAGYSWSLWSAKGQSGATALENGGLVLDGREYGLCPGYPNPAELEMLDVGPEAIVYGVVGYPGLAKIDLSVGQIDSFTPGTALPTPQVQVVNGVSFFIGALPKPACSYTAFELNTTSPGVSAEHNLGFGGAGEGQGYTLSDNTGNTGGCVAGEIDPISFSQGIWQLPPGQFQTGEVELG